MADGRAFRRAGRERMLAVSGNRVHRMHALFASPRFDTIVFYATVILCFAPELYRSWLRPLDAGAVKRDRGSHVAVVLSISIGVFFAIFLANARLPGTSIAWQPLATFWIGIGLMLAGFAFRHYAIHTLGKFFTHTVATRAGQVVIDTGPYRWIRHPSYSGSLVSFIGLGLALGNWASIVALLGCAAIGFAWRVHVEEQALCADLGQPYRDYMQRTKRFIPAIW